MRQSDVISVIIIAAVGTLGSYFLVGHFLGDPNLLHADITTVGEISAELVDPDPELFNPAAINPTVEVFVGDCKDIDQNGILSKEELIICEKLPAETTEPEEENAADQTSTYTCDNGMVVVSAGYCPEFQNNVPSPTAPAKTEGQ